MLDTGIVKLIDVEVGDEGVTTISSARLSTVLSSSNFTENRRMLSPRTSGLIAIHISCRSEFLILHEASIRSRALGPNSEKCEINDF